MPDRSLPAPSEPPSPAELRSGWAFTIILALALLAIGFPQMAPQALQGILWTGAGAAMLLFPPEQRLPRLWLLLGLAFVSGSAVGFLPRGMFAIPDWRTDVEALGVDPGSRNFVQPWLSAEMWAGFAMTALVGLYLLGHRVNTALHLRLALGFVVATGLWVAFALKTHVPGELFGFFPNRNHTATLLSMGGMAGIGVLAQAIRRKAPWAIALSAVPALLCFYALLTVSESRAGIILAAGGILLWLVATGFRACRGHAGKAILLLAGGFFALFLTVDSKVKERLSKSVDQLQAVPSEAGGIVFGDASQPVVGDPPADGRISIYQDTLAMISGESWTGVGPGQFSRIFPQYRQLTTAPNDSVCLHPESDWLMMLAETGWLATASLAAAVIAAFLTAVTQIRQGRGKLLRAGTLVAAALLAIHGVFDVPGHRVGLAWAGALLLALSLRPSPEAVRKSPTRILLGRMGWRMTGFVALAAGAVLLHAQWLNRPFLPSSQKMAAMLAAEALYRADQAAYEKARSEGRDYQPSDEEDLLLKALARVDDAIQLTPLDPQLHSVRSQLALYYDDKHATAEQSQAIQLRLEPQRVSIALDQAKAWREQDPARAGSRWEEALRRADAEQSRNPTSQFALRPTFQRVLHDAGWESPFPSITATVASNYPDVLAIWAESAPPNTLDREMPGILSRITDDTERRRLRSIWARRGSATGGKNHSSALPGSASPPLQER